LNDHNLVTSAQVNAATASQVATLYSLGARIFEIALLPASVSAFTDSADNFNPGYETLVPELQAEYPDATFNLSNWGPDYNTIHDNPSQYGLTNTTDPCNSFGASPTCSTPNTYFYYYVDHPSTYVHQIVGNELYNEVLGLSSPVPEPSTWAMMVLGYLGDDGARLPGPRLRRLSQRKNEGDRLRRREPNSYSFKAALRAAFLCFWRGRRPMGRRVDAPGA
jgi:cholinesterase